MQGRVPIARFLMPAFLVAAVAEGSMTVPIALPDQLEAVGEFRAALIDPCVERVRFVPSTQRDFLLIQVERAVVLQTEYLAEFHAGLRAGRQPEQGLQRRELRDAQFFLNLPSCTGFVAFSRIDVPRRGRIP